MGGYGKKITGICVAGEEDGRVNQGYRSGFNYRQATERTGVPVLSPEVIHRLPAKNPLRERAHRNPFSVTRWVNRGIKP